jgi:hypothetical protein
MNSDSERVFKRIQYIWVRGERRGSGWDGPDYTVENILTDVLMSTIVNTRSFLLNNKRKIATLWHLIFYGCRLFFF